MHYLNRLCFGLCLTVLSCQIACFEGGPDNSNHTKLPVNNTPPDNDKSNPSGDVNKNYAKQLLQQLMDLGRKMAVSGTSAPSIPDELLEQCSAKIEERCSTEEIAKQSAFLHCLLEKEGSASSLFGLNETCMSPNVRLKCSNAFDEAQGTLSSGTSGVREENSYSKQFSLFCPTSIASHVNTNTMAKQLCRKVASMSPYANGQCVDSLPTATMSAFDKCGNAVEDNCTSTEIKEYLELLDKISLDGHILAGNEDTLTPQIRVSCRVSIAQNAMRIIMGFNSNDDVCWINTTVYVDSVSKGGGDGSSWENAFSSLQKAVDEAHKQFKRDGLPRHVLVAKGIYTSEDCSDAPVLVMREGVRILGRFHGSGSIAYGQNENDVPILDGQNRSTHVVIAASNASLAGFKIINGNADKSVSYIDSKVGAGLYASSVRNLTLDYLYFEGNKASLTGDDIYLENSQVSCSNIQTTLRVDAQTTNEGVYLRNSSCSGSDSKLETGLSVNRSTFGSVTENGGDETLEDLWSRRSESKDGK